MAKYKVLKPFKNKNTKNWYDTGQEIELSVERANEMIANQKKRGGGFLERIDETSHTADGEYPKHVGGGHYELSDGSKVQGKEKAAEAEKALQE